LSGRAGDIALGILQLALLQAEGIGQFGDSRPAFLASLVPLIAFPLVGGLLGLLSGAGLAELAALLGALVGLLAPPVLSEAMAGRFGRQQEWLRYATAFNWTRWAMVLALGAGLMLMALLAAVGLGHPAAVALGLLLVLTYGVVLDLFVARVGLRLAWWRAALLVFIVNGGSALLWLGPRLLAGVQEGIPL
jgi:sterol desaturase/sphingolipid hydroxylase (fatty acid hydroxylase superfamily)